MSSSNDIIHRISSSFISISLIKRWFHLKNKSTFIEHKKKTIVSIKSSKQISHHKNKQQTSFQRVIQCSEKLFLRSWRMIYRKSLKKSNCRCVFDFLDRNNQSRLDYSQFRAWILLIDRNFNEKLLKQLFNDIDHNGDGFIEYKEFSDSFENYFSFDEPTITDLTDLFHDINQTCSSEITIEQLLKYFNQESSMISQQEGELFLSIASNNGNHQKITLHEFLRLMDQSLND